VGDGNAFFEALQERGIIVRPLAPYGMDDYVRITIGRPEENERLLSVVSQLTAASP
jgi:histidinol-phosphate aminotransferase